jgi:hypothetical protein
VKHHFQHFFEYRKESAQNRIIVHVHFSSLESSALSNGDAWIGSMPISKSLSKNAGRRFA